MIAGSPKKDNVFTLIRKLNTVTGSPKKWTRKRQRFYADSETQHGRQVAKKRPHNFRERPTTQLGRGDSQVTSERGRPRNLEEKTATRLQREADHATWKRGWPSRFQTRNFALSTAYSLYIPNEVLFPEIWPVLHRLF